MKEKISAFSSVKKENIKTPGPKFGAPQARKFLGFWAYSKGKTLFQGFKKGSQIKIPKLKKRKILKPRIEDLDNFQDFQP